MGDRRSDDPVGPLAPRPACHCLEKKNLKTRTPLFFEGPCFFAEGLVFRPLEKTTLKKQPPKTSVITTLRSSSAGGLGLGLGVPIRFEVQTPPADQVFQRKIPPRHGQGLTPRQNFRRVKFSEKVQLEIRQPQNAKQKTQLEMNRTTKRFMRLAKCCECGTTRH